MRKMCLGCGCEFNAGVRQVYCGVCAHERKKQEALAKGKSPRRKWTNNEKAIHEIVRAAEAAGMSYGEYLVRNSKAR